MAKKKAASKNDTQPLIVTCSGDRPVHEVVKDLKDAGFQVSQVLDAIGSVTGSAPAKSKNTLKKSRLLFEPSNLCVVHTRDDV